MKVSLQGLSRALRGPIPVVCLCTAAMFKLFVLGALLPGRIKEWDFDLYYASAFALRTHLNPYTPDFHSVATTLGINLSADFRTDYTPSFLLVVEPLTKLTMSEAYWTWTSLSLVAFGLTLWLLLRPATSGLDGSTASILVALSILYAPVGTHFLYGQSQTFIMLMLTVAMKAMKRGSDWAAGVMIAAAGLLRAFPLLMIGYLVVRRKWRALGWTAATLAVGAATTFVMIGWDCVDFVQGMNWATRRAFLENPSNLSIGAFVSRLFWWLQGRVPGLGSDYLRMGAVAIAVAFVLALTISATRSSINEEQNWSAFGLWIIASIMLSPIAWSHYLVLLIIPYVQLAIASQARRATRRALLMAMGSYIVIGTTGTAVSGIPELHRYLRVLNQSMFVSMLMAYLAMYWFVFDDRNNVVGATAEPAFSPAKSV